MLVWPLALGGAAATLYALALLVLSPVQTATLPDDLVQGHAFELTTTFTLAAFVLLITLMSAALNAWLGSASLIYGAAATGLIDAHSVVASVSGLVGSGKLPLTDTPWAVLAALTSNTLTKSVIAIYSGSAAYRWRVLPGLLLLMAVVWLSALATLP
jgi:hypothetical protein